MVRGIQVLCIALVMSFLCEGTGNALLSICGMKKKGYAAPYGMAFLFAMLEIVYIPATCLHLSSEYCAVMTSAVLLVAAAATVRYFKESISSYLERDTIAVVLSSVLYILIMHHAQSTGAVQILDTMVANSYVQAVDTGVNFLQGYTVLGAMMLKVMSAENFMVIMGTFYHLLFAQVCLDIIRTFQLKNPWFVFTLVLYAVFYTGFNEWQIITAFSGDNWRILCITILLWHIYCDVQSENCYDKSYLACIAVLTAGMFVSAGFATISASVLYCYLAWQLKNRKVRSLRYFLYMLLPQMVYCSLLIARKNTAVAIVVMAVYVCFLIFKSTKQMRRVLARAEDALFDHAVEIFYIGIPVLTCIITLLLWVFQPVRQIPYSLYAQFLKMEPVRSYLFLDHSLLTIILDIFRWCGLFIFIYFGKKKEENQLRSMLFLMVVFFLNPLCMGTVARVIGFDDYAFIFETVFNPFTDLLLFIAVYRMFEWQSIGQWVLEIFLVAAVLIGHVSSFTNYPFGLYENLIPSGHIEEGN